MKRAAVVGVMICAAGAALAQSASVPMQAIPNPPQAAPAPPKAAPFIPPPATTDAAPAASVAPQGGTVLMLRGLEKITGRPTNITAAIGKPVQFASLTITARFCYSTPPNETPETAAFVQIDDHRPDQSTRKIFSGWMYGSSPGLNAVEHPLYDVWVIGCNNNIATVAANASNAVAKVKAPDSSDKGSTIEALPEGAGQ